MSGPIASGRGAVAGRLLALARAADRLLFPRVCPLCGGEGEHGPFCAGCRRGLLAAGGPACDRCAMSLGPWADRRGGCFDCRGRPLGFDAAVALGPYDGPIRDLCLAIKHERDAWLAPWLAALLPEARPALRAEAAGAWVVPVPLHWRRRWSRGYNQAEALARGLAGELALPVRRALRRVSATPVLASRGRVERARLMRDAFLARPRPELRGRTVLLVDDILTTGATCGAAARALKRAGASRVCVAVIGRAEGRT